MTFEEIEQIAVCGGKSSECRSLPELECFRCLTSLYGDYRKGRIGKEDAGREKAVIHRQFDAAVEEYTRRAEIYRQVQENIHAAGERWNSLPKRMGHIDRDGLVTELLDIISAMVGENVTAMAVRKAGLDGDTGIAIPGGNLQNQPVTNIRGNKTKDD